MLGQVSFTEIAIAEIDLNKKLTSQTHWTAKSDQKWRYQICTKSGGY